MKKMLLNIVGILSLVLGLIGILLPVLPTTPFIVLASICFAGNEKMQKILQKNKYFAEYVNNYKNKEGVSVSVKVRSIVFVNLSIIISQTITTQIWLKIVLLAIAFFISLHILLLKVKK